MYVHVCARAYIRVCENIVSEAGLIHVLATGFTYIIIIIIFIIIILVNYA